uniref:Uncharacterized protein n=1 Tax=viral metagenome TaxID=1070528 RepID=A0A6H1ZD08_9ZZZZ
MSKFIRVTAFILTVLFLIGAIWYGLDYKNDKINRLQNEINILWNYKLNEPSLREKIAKLENDNAKLQQELDNLNIRYAADQKYIDYVNSQYLKSIIWINIAELIFENNDIMFPLYLGDRELNQ